MRLKWEAVRDNNIIVYCNNHCVDIWCSSIRFGNIVWCGDGWVGGGGGNMCIHE